MTFEEHPDMPGMRNGIAIAGGAKAAWFNSWADSGEHDDRVVHEVEDHHDRETARTHSDRRQHRPER